jgi:hypothetical protein
MDLMQVKQSEQNQTQSPQPKSLNSSVAGRKAVRNRNQRGVSGEAEMEIGKDADAAWKDQIRALLVALSEEEGGEEEWEVTEAP